jgi:hypothetical protein
VELQNKSNNGRGEAGGAIGEVATETVAEAAGETMGREGGEDRDRISRSMSAECPRSRVIKL